MSSPSSNPFHEKLYSQLPQGGNFYNIQKLDDKRIQQVSTHRGGHEHACTTGGAESRSNTSE